MNCCLGLGALFAASSMLLPLWAAADSRIEAGTGSVKLSATAHVDFTIVIPEALFLGVPSGEILDSSALPVTIYSNSRNVTLAATSGSMAAARHGVVLSAAARKRIAREASCQLPDARGARGGWHPVPALVVRARNQPAARTASPQAAD